MLLCVQAAMDKLANIEADKSAFMISDITKHPVFDNPASDSLLVVKTIGFPMNFSIVL